MSRYQRPAATGVPRVSVRPDDATWQISDNRNTAFRAAGLARVSYAGVVSSDIQSRIRRRVIDVDIITITEVVRRPSEKPGSD